MYVYIIINYYHFIVWTQTTDWITMSFVPFGERAMEMSVSLYTQIANKRAVIQARILHSIVKVSG